MRTNPVVLPPYRRLLAALLVAVSLLAVVPRPVAAQTTEADLFVAQAVLDFDDKRYDEALIGLRRALEIEPDHLEALYYTALVRMAQGKPDEAVAPLQRARQKAPADSAITFQLGLAYFAQQRYDLAQPLLEEVFKAQPTLDGLGYYVGFMRYRAKDYRGARDAFKAGRANDPRLQQLTKFYSGLTLAALGLPVEAAAEVDQALSLIPGSALTGPAERLRDQIASSKRERGRLFNVDLRVGAVYDTNVPVIPDSDNNEPLVPILRQAKQDSPGWLASARFSYNWLDREHWSSYVSYQFYATLYSDLSKFNLTDHVFSTALNYKTPVYGMFLQTGISYDFDALFLDQKEFIQRNSGSLSASLVESERNLTQVFARFQDKKFFQTSDTIKDERRSGENYMAGFIHLFRFAQDRHYIKLGYQWDWDDTEGRNYEYVGNRLIAGAQYTLPWGAVRLKYDVDVHFTDYRNKDTIFPSLAPGIRWRYDEEVTHSARVEVPLAGLFKGGPEWTKSFTLSADWLGTYVHSNVAIFKYARSFYTTSINWSY